MLLLRQRKHAEVLPSAQHQEAELSAPQVHQPMAEGTSQGAQRLLVDHYVHDALADEERRLTSEKELLSGQMSGSHEQQEALTRLLKYTAKGRTITEFDDELFTEHVDHVVIYKRTEIGFAMKCGPIFRERI